MSVILVHQGVVSALGVGMLGESPAGSANGRLGAVLLLPPKGLAAGLPLEGPKGLTGVLSAVQQSVLRSSLCVRTDHRFLRPHDTV